MESEWIYCTGVNNKHNSCVCNKKLLQCTLNNGSWISMKCPRCSTINEAHAVKGTNIPNYIYEEPDAEI